MARRARRGLAAGDANQVKAGGTPRRSAAAGRSTASPSAGAVTSGRRAAGGGGLAAGDGVLAAVGRRQRPTPAAETAIGDLYRKQAS